jgi:hypothetical protein
MIDLYLQRKKLGGLLEFKIIPQVYAWRFC